MYRNHLYMEKGLLSNVYCNASCIPFGNILQTQGTTNQECMPPFVPYRFMKIKKSAGARLMTRICELLEFIKRHKQKVRNQIPCLKRHMELIAYKINHYEECKASGAKVRAHKKGIGVFYTNISLRQRMPQV